MHQLGRVNVRQSWATAALLLATPPVSSSVPVLLGCSNPTWCLVTGAWPGCPHWACGQKQRLAALQ